MFKQRFKCEKWKEVFKNNFSESLPKAAEKMLKASKNEWGMWGHISLEVAVSKRETHYKRRQTSETVFKAKMYSIWNSFSSLGDVIHHSRAMIPSVLGLRSLMFRV